MAEPVTPAGDPARPWPAKADQVAWAVLAELLKPDGTFATFPVDGLRHLIDLRLAAEASRSGVPVPALAAAFEHALRDLIGADRQVSDADITSDAIETVDDL